MKKTTFVFIQVCKELLSDCGVRGTKIIVDVRSTACSGSKEFIKTFIIISLKFFKTAGNVVVTVWLYKVCVCVYL